MSRYRFKDLCDEITAFLIIMAAPEYPEILAGPE